MKRVRQFWSFGIRSVLLLLFFSFYLIMIAVNADRIEENFDPLRAFKSPPVKVRDDLYVGSYPTATELKRLHQEFGVEKVICLLDPRFPVSRELVANEKRNCDKEGILFVSLVARDFKRINDMLPIISEIMDEDDKVTYINAYFLNRQVEHLSVVLASGEEQNP